MSNKKITKKKVKEKKVYSKITTIKLAEETKKRLEKLREHKGESYDDILRKILFVLNTARDDPQKAKGILERIDEIRKRIAEEKRQEKEDAQEGK